MASVTPTGSKQGSKDATTRRKRRSTVGGGGRPSILPGMLEASHGYVAIPAEDSGAVPTLPLNQWVVPPKPEPWHRCIRSEWWDSNAEDMLERASVQMMSAGAIFLNAVVIGFETDIPEKLPWDLIEDGFLFFFTSDLVFRIYAMTPEKYFGWAHNKDFAWNMFDTAIVSLGLFDFTSTAMNPHAKKNSFATLFRIVRLLRILRIFKIVRFLKQLYLLAHGFVEGMQAVFWVTVMMTFLLYICSIVLVRCYTKAVQADDPDYELLTTKFSTIPQTMFTLFELMSSPDLVPYHDLVYTHPTLMLFFIAFVIFGSFGMIALLTGVISESMFEKNEVKIQEEGKEREDKRNKFRQAFGELFDSLDTDHSQFLSREELDPTKPVITALFEAEGVDFARHELDNIFDILDSDSSGFIERDEFINGTIQLCDAVRPMSIMELNMQVNHISKTLSRQDAAMDDMSETLQKVSERSDEIAALAEKVSELSGMISRIAMSQTQTLVQIRESREDDKDTAKVMNELLARQKEFATSLQHLTQPPNSPTPRASVPTACSAAIDPSSPPPAVPATSVAAVTSAAAEPVAAVADTTAVDAEAPLSPPPRPRSSVHSQKVSPPASSPPLELQSVPGPPWDTDPGSVRSVGGKKNPVRRIVRLGGSPLVALSPRGASTPVLQEPAARTAAPGDANGADGAVFGPPPSSAGAERRAGECLLTPPMSREGTLD